MAVCRVCRKKIPDNQEYCKECFEKYQKKMDESYLDSLLKSIQPPEKLSSNTTNRNHDLSDSRDKSLLLNNKSQNIMEQDERILKREFNKENELNTSTDDDILSMLQDYPDDNKSDDVDGLDFYFDTDDDVGMEDTDEDLLALLDMISAQDETKSDNSNILAEEEKKDRNHESTKDKHSDEDLTDSTILSIDNLSSEVSESMKEDLSQEEKKSNTSDVGDIFSDVLNAVDTLSDKDQAAFDKEVPLPTDKENVKQENSQAKKDKNSKKGLFKKKGKKKEKKQAGKDKTEVILSEDNESEKNGEDVKEKKNKKVKPKKIKKKKAGLISENKEEDFADTSTSKPKVKQSKKVKKLHSKKKLKTKENKAANEKPNEVLAGTENHVKINKAAIIFVMTFFILLGGVIIIGTNLYSYSLNIRGASTEFSRKRYEEAYNRIYGLDLRKSDRKLYNKIMTVMYVKKELNSYKNYMDINMYPEALDSLLKGLKRYDQYIDKAKELGIKDDLDNVREQVLTELKTQFDMTEEEADKINSSKDQAKYSINVIKMAKAKKN